MNDRNRVINEIIKANKVINDEVIVNTSKIAKLLNKKQQNVYRTVMHLVDDGVLIKQGEKTNKYKFSKPDKIKFDFSEEVELILNSNGITLTCNEAIRIYGYLYHQCNIYNNKYNSTLENIGKENNISDKNKISEILKELQERNLINWVIGDYHEGKASEFSIITSEQVNEEIDVVDTTINNNNNNEVNDTTMEEVIKKQQERITFLEEEIKRLNTRIDKMAKLFKEKVLDKESNNHVKEIKNVTPIPNKTITPVTPQCIENNVHQPHVRYKHDDFTRIKIKLFQDRFQIMNADVPKSDCFDFSALHNIGINGKDVIINDVVSVLKDNFTYNNLLYALKTIAPYCEVYESIVNEIFDMCDTDTEKQQIIVTWFNNILQ